jgi:hypothetical protein
MKFFTKKSNLFASYEFLLLFLQNQKISKQKNKEYDINENSANKHKIRCIKIAFNAFLFLKIRHFQVTTRISKSVRSNANLLIGCNGSSNTSETDLVSPRFLYPNFKTRRWEKPSHYIKQKTNIYQL